MKLHNPFSASDILFWVEVCVWSPPPSVWWYVAACHDRHPVGLDRQFPWVPLSHYSLTWYPCPVVATADQHTKFQIAFPSHSFWYQQRKLAGYTYCNNNAYSYYWIRPDIWVRPHLHPTPCHLCGWYCNQSCTKEP